MQPSLIKLNFSNSVPSNEQGWLETNVNAQISVSKSIWVFIFASGLGLVGWVCGQISREEHRDNLSQVYARKKIKKWLEWGFFAKLGREGKNLAPNFFVQQFSLNKDNFII